MLEKKQARRITKGKINSQSQLTYNFFYLVANTLFSRHFIRVSVLAAITVWTVWLITTGPSRAFSNLMANWEAAVTMVFGSIVAGGTSMGGGAVAFPVFTKVLHVSPHDAKVFSLAIQSVGMSAASVTIVAMGTKVEWRFIRWASLGGVFGIILGSVFLAPVLPSDVIKISFTTMVSSFAVVLFALNQTRRPKLAISFWRNRERVISLVAGFWGGIVSGLVGSGMDIFGFSVLVLLFGMCEKISTSTSVILMAVNAMAGLILHKYFIGDFVESILDYWLAAVPVVVVGAPIGAILCSLLKRKTIVRILIGLISIELVSSLLLIPLNATLIYSSLFVFVLFSAIYYWMYQAKVYIQKDKYNSNYWH
ncbi:MAG: sulfite exporter TauE/SafE family protein [Pleurocapsa sp. MO_192.B19]|nr:sulfite exporter TauE/SafE family protein [Pleurocapsa sp. MO_192.B19]